MTVSISKYKLSTQQHTITLDYTLGENKNPFTDLYAFDFQAFFRIGMRFVKHEMVWLLSNQTISNKPHCYETKGFRSLMIPADGKLFKRVNKLGSKINEQTKSVNNNVNVNFV